MGEITIKLLKPLDIGGDVKIDEVVLREPTAREYFEIGEPIQYQRTADKAVVGIEMDDAISAYIKRLVIKPDIPAQVGNLSLPDAIRVKDGLLDFFRESQVRARSVAPNS